MLFSPLKSLKLLFSEENCCSVLKRLYARNKKSRIYNNKKLCLERNISKKNRKKCYLHNFYKKNYGFVPPLTGLFHCPWTFDEKSTFLPTMTKVQKKLCCG